jgi:hypothetical protein
VAARTGTWLVCVGHAGAGLLCVVDLPEMSRWLGHGLYKPIADRELWLSLATGDIVSGVTIRRPEPIGAAKTIWGAVVTRVRLGLACPSP